MFAKIVVEAVPSDVRSFKFDIDEDLRGIDTHYASTIQAAIRLAEEKWLFRLDRNDLARLDVVIKELVIAPADTTCMAVFYATLLALGEALGAEVPDVDVDWSERELKLKF